MKLPDLTYTRTPETLGRPDPGQYRGYAAAWGNVAAAGVSLAQQVYKRAGAEEYTRLEGELKKDLTDLEVQLTSKTAFSPDEIPDHTEFKDTEVDEVGDEQFRESIPAEEVRLQWYEGAVKDLEAKYRDKADNKFARDRILKDLRNKLSPAGYDRMAMFTVKETITNQKATVQAAVDTAIADGDMASADRALIRGKVAGIIGKADYEVMREEAQQNIDRNLYMDQIAGSETESALDNLYDDLVAGESLALVDKKTKMSYEQRNHLFGIINRQKAEMHQQKQELYDRTGRDGVRLFLDGNMTDAWLDLQLKYDRIDDATARALIGMRASGSATIKDAGKIDRYKSYIKTLMWPAEGDTVSNLARNMRRELIQESGKGELGGEELDTLLDEIDSTEKMLTGSASYKQAIALIKSYVGITDVMTIESDPKAEAWNAFRNALFQHVDRLGAESDPVQFYHDNKDNFDPALFEDTRAKRFVNMYPEYSKYRREASSYYGKSLGERIDQDKVAADLMRRYREGELSYDEVIFRWTELLGGPPSNSELEGMLQ